MADEPKPDEPLEVEFEEEDPEAVVTDSQWTIGIRSLRDEVQALKARIDAIEKEKGQK
jgi:hypothetical protein